MKLITSKFLITIVLFQFFYSCSVHEDIEKVPIADREIDELNILNGFDFSTHQDVKVIINDNNSVKYDIYAYTDEKYFAGIETFQNEEGNIVTDSVFKSDVLNRLIFTGTPINGELSQTITLPKYYDKLYIRRKDNLKYSASIVNIYNQEVNYTAPSITTGKSSSIKSSVEEYLYGVNGSGDLFQINPLTGESVYVSDMPMGSYTCAIDQENKALYSIGRQSPYPLMKYSITSNEWETVANIGQGGSRLVFNNSDKLLYFSSGSTLYTIDPMSGVIISSWNIKGLHISFGGDLEFSNNGSLFLCSFSGVYKLELNSNNEYESTRINNSLPFLFLPTSMTFDSNNELWVSNFYFNSDLIVMNTQTGDWEYKFGNSANNNSNLNRSITDLSTFKILDEVEAIDTDNDGVPDAEDSYPEDSDKAFEVFTPSQNGWATIAFEDLWPTVGDSDFNDLAIGYRIVNVLNAENLVVQLNMVINVKSNGASNINGFGLELESISPSLIESVTGNVLSQGYINQSSNGTESGQENAVVILFDNARTMLNKQIVVAVKFSEPIATETLGLTPFNPFMIVNEIREKEVHLPYGHTTSLGNKNIEVNGSNRDLNGDYISEGGLPWAINVLYDFKVPKEKVSISQAYNFFNQWATSGGLQFVDWFKDNPSYINEDKVED